MKEMCIKCYKYFDKEVITKITDDLGVCPDCLEKIKNSTPREYTEGEIREKLIKHFWGILEYWEKESRTTDTRGKMEGMLHSILATLDGCSMDIPGFEIIPICPDEDIEYHKEMGENWYPKQDIGGGLHEIMYNYKPK